MKELISNRIKEYRTRKGITQEELAGRVGVSRQSIISIEKGHYIPSLPLAFKIAEFFRCPVEKIFRREEVKS
jgi:putative transcriptional regulator